MTEDPEVFYSEDFDGEKISCYWHVLCGDGDLTHLVFDDEEDMPYYAFGIKEDKDFDYNPEEQKILCTACFNAIADNEFSEDDDEIEFDEDDNGGLSY